MPSVYKIYARILVERLREEMENKSMRPPNQTRFRRGMGTIDNLYTLNYLINRNVDKKGGKMIALFVDLKAILDSVDKKILEKPTKKRGVRVRLIKRVVELLWKTRSRVRVAGEVREKFWTVRRSGRGAHLPLYCLIWCWQMWRRWERSSGG